MNRLDGKVAIVTGGGSGLGAACCEALAREGATVVVTDIDTENGQQVAKNLGAPASFLEHDVRSEEAWQSVIAETVERFGRLDVLVNNAGVVVVATIEDTTLEQLRFVESVNLEGPFLGCKHAIPAMERGGGGSIINVSSTAGLVGTPPFAAYSATKGALRSITQTVAYHCRLKDNGIRCNSIHPGGMNTPMVQNLGNNDPSPEALKMMGQVMAEKIFEPSDTATAVVYLASDESRFINGAKIAIDNGVTAG